MYGIVASILFVAALLAGAEVWDRWGYLITSVPTENWHVSLVVFVTWASLHTLRKFVR